MTKNLQKPILLLIFNRPDLTSQVIERIRDVRPEKLFVAADGPRSDGEAEACLSSRRIVESYVDWDCEVKTLYRKNNLGCRKAVSEAISWFFEQVEDGIILEDDCLPDVSFFAFCSEMLEKFRDDKRIMSISGNNFQPESSNGSYYFSIFSHVWGWATWRRSWKLYDGGMLNWPTIRESEMLRGLFSDEEHVRYWTEIFDKTSRGEIDSWAYVWTYSCWTQSGLTALPTKNLVANIGFDQRATHTKFSEDGSSYSVANCVKFPIQHPIYLMRDTSADAFTMQHHYGVSSVTLESKIRDFISKLRRIIP